MFGSWAIQVWIPPGGRSNPAGDGQERSYRIGGKRNGDALLPAWPAHEKVSREDAKAGKCALNNAPDGSNCDDGNPETKGDKCVLGACVAGTDTSICAENADCDAKEDGNVCNGTLYCDKLSQKCAVNKATIISCPTANDTACDKSTCNAGSGKCELKSAKNGTPCDDGDKCTAGDICLFGECSAGQQYSCVCKTNADCVTEDDGDLCNGVAFCNQATKKCEPNPISVVQCQSVDDTACLINACQPKTGKCGMLPTGEVVKVCDLGAAGTAKACRFAAKPPAAATVTNIPCEDGDSCTQGDRCQAGKCSPGPDTCPCKSAADCLVEDDGDLCNGVPTCNVTTGKCDLLALTKPVYCSKADDTACVANQCDPKSGACGLAPRNFGKTCDDGQVCTIGEVCGLDGTCIGGKPNTCDDKDACTQDKCASPTATSTGGCEHPPLCGDGNLCTVDQCDGKTGKCTFSTGLMDGKTCPGDGNGCTINDACGKGVCAAGPTVKCSLPTKACEAASCLSTGPTTFQCIVQDAKDGAACDDGEPCRINDRCKAGTCSPGDGYRIATTNSAAENGAAIYYAVAAAPDDSIVVVGRISVVPPNQTGVNTGWTAIRYDAGTQAKGSTSYFYGLSDQTTAQAVAVSPGGTKIVVAGKVAASQGAPAYGRLLIASSTFEAIKVVDFGNTGAEEVGGVIFHGADHVVVGGRTVQSDGYAYVRKISETGKFLGEHVNKALVGSRFYAVARRKDGKLIAAGTVRTASQSASVGDYLGLLVRVDPSTLKQEQVRLDDAGAQGLAWRSATLVNNDVLLAGDLTDKDGKTTVRIARVGADATVQFAKDWLGDGAVRQVLATNDGGGLFIARAGAEADVDKHRWWLRSYGATGALRWEERYSHGTPTGPYGATWTTAGALVMVGHSRVTVSSTNVTVGQIQRVDAWGHSQCATAGKCVTKADSDCDDGNLCTDDLCEPSKGCVHVANLAPCEDGNQCTVEDSCKDNKCAAGVPRECPESGVCEVVSCQVAQGCVATKDKAGTVCDDGDSCTKADACSAAGACVGSLDPCNDGVGCTADSCVTGKGCQHAPKDAFCDDKNPCTDDVCELVKGCVGLPNKATCDDGLPCSAGARCEAGKCLSGGKDSKLWSLGLGRGSPVNGKTPTTGTSGAHGVALGPDGGIYIAGWQRPGANNHTRALRLDAAGKTLWDKAVGDAQTAAGGWEVLNAVVTDDTGAFFIGEGTTKSNGGSDGLVIGLKADGGARFKFRYGGSNNDGLNDAVLATDGGIVAVGVTRSHGDGLGDGWLLKVSAQGFEQASVDIPMSGVQGLNTVIAVQGKYIAAGFSYQGPHSSRYLWTVGLDPSGKVLWSKQKSFGGCFPASGWRLHELSDGSVALTGSRREYGCWENHQLGVYPLVWVMSSDGDLRWMRQYPPTQWPMWNDHRGAGVLAELGGRLVVGGYQVSKSHAQPVMRHFNKQTGELLSTQVLDAKAANSGDPLYRMRFADGVAAARGLFMVGQRTETGELVAARVDAWGSAQCSESGACADKGITGCDDGNACTNESCTQGKCAPAPVANRACEDNTFCTASHRCDSGGTCQPYSEKIFTKHFKYSGYFRNWLTTAVPHPDGGVFVVGGAFWDYRGFAYAGMLDGGGNVTRHSVEVFTSSNGYVRDQLDDVAAIPGRYIAVGGNSPYSHGHYGVIKMYDLAGELLANHKVVSPGDVEKTSSRGFLGVARIDDDHVAIAGWSRSKANVDGVWLLGYQASTGTIEWQFRDPKQTGAFIDVAVTSATDASPAKIAALHPGALRRFDTAGKFLEEIKITYNNETITALRSVVVAADGELLVLSSVPSKQAFVHRVDAANKVSLISTLALETNKVLSSLVELQDGRLAMAGAVDQPGLSGQGLLALFDPAAGKWTEIAVGDAGKQSFRSVTELPDGSLFAVGQVGTQAIEFFTARFSPWGHDKCVKAGFCADTPLSDCIDTNPCTLDSCAPATGCTHTPVKDGTACGGGKSCKAGSCG